MTDRRSLAKLYRAMWKRPQVQSCVREIGLIGTQSIFVVKEISKIFDESKWYRKKVLAESLEIIKPALLIEDLTHKAIEDAQVHACSKLMAICPSFFMMGLIAGYVAARTEILEEAKNQSK